MLEAARRAPDHGRIKPWHLVVLDEGAKQKFAAAAAEAKRRRTPALTRSNSRRSAKRSCVRRPLS